jgi:hypothetical protein
MEFLTEMNTRATFRYETMPGILPGRRSARASVLDLLLLTSP